MTAPARSPADHAERELIATVFDRTLFVEAGAGTGKTHALVSRVVGLVASGHLDSIRQLAAITFTEAAAAELRERIRSGLESAAGTESDPVAAERCASALAEIDDAAISTLHGFAQRLLTEFPLEVGLPPGFEVVDPIEAGIRFEERWAAFVDELFADPTIDPVLRRAFTLKAQLSHLREVAQELHAHWDRLDGAAPEVPEALAAVDVGELQRLLDEAITVAHACPPSDRLAGHVDDEVVPFANALARAAERHGAAGDDPNVEADLLLLLLDDAPRFAPGNVGSRSDPAVVDLRERLSAVARAHAEWLDELRRDVLVRLVARVVDHTLDGADERIREGRLEFHDLLVLAARLLHEPAVRHALRDRYRAVLIDEFQDTDPLQAEIAVLLSLADPDGTPPGWSKAAVEPGRLFLVGDPKQSIYRFRRADITVYEAAKVALPDTVVALSANFRSRKGVIEFANAAFGRLIEHVPGAQPEYLPLTAHRGEPSTPIGAAVRVLGQPHERDRRVGEIRELEASEVAAVIQQMRATGQQVVDERTGELRPMRLDDVAILLPTRTSLGVLERALDAAGLPYRVESRSLVFGSDEVQELLGVLQAVENPSDEVAVVAALRSPVLACSDAHLAEYRAAGGRWRYPVHDELDLPDDHPVLSGMRTLDDLHRRMPWLPVNELVDEIIRVGHLAEATAVRNRPRDHWRRYRLLLDEARSFVEAGGRSLGDFVAWIELQADERASRLETIVPEADDDAVRILTVHGAKGLEFPIVFLSGLNAPPMPRHPRVVWHDDRCEVCIGRSGEYFRTEGFEEVAALEKQMLDLEQRRLLYVAATRARDVLVVSVHHKAGSPSLAADLHAVLDEAPAEHLGAVDIEPVALAPDSGANDHGSGAELDPAALADVARAWEDERERLLERARRPTNVAPTALAHLAGAAGGDEVGETEGADDAASSTGDEDTAPEPGRRGRAATAIGRAVHATLQLVDLHDPTELASLARHQAAAEGLPEAAEEVEALARSAFDSEPVHAARRSGRFWRELFVAAEVDGVVIEGYVDLLYEDGDGELVVVDYKTDRGSTEAAIDAALARHRLQGAAYAVAVEQAVGRPVRRVELVFCRPGRAIVRAIDDLAAARADVRAALTG